MTPDIGGIRNLHYVATVLILLGLWIYRKRGCSVPKWGMPVVLGGAFVILGLHAYLLFAGFRLNGIDFSIFDTMLKADFAQFGYSPICECNHLGIHPMGILLPLIPLHHWFSSPLFLVLLHPLIYFLGVWPL